MKNQLALFIASLAFLFITMAGVAGATHSQTLPRLSLPSVPTGAIAHVLHFVAQYCQNGECVPQE